MLDLQEILRGLLVRLLLELLKLFLATTDAALAPDLGPQLRISWLQLTQRDIRNPKTVEEAVVSCCL